MQAVILAGGKGTRLRPLTYSIPKPMVPIGGRPFLWYQVQFLKAFGIRDILLLVGYLGDRIEEYFGGGAEFGLSIVYSREETLLGTGGALKNARDKLAGEFLLLNGDTFLPMFYPELIYRFHCSGKTGVLTVYGNPDGIAPNNIAVGEAGLVTGYDREDPSRMTHLDAGAMVFKKSLLELIPSGKVCSLEGEIFRKLISRAELAAFVTSQRFYDMGSLHGLELVKEVLR
jgi:NDP-sugar pyrophosphorylase family protein